MIPDTTVYKYPWVSFDAWVAADKSKSHGESLPVKKGEAGEAVITAPWPYMA